MTNLDRKANEERQAGSKTPGKVFGSSAEMQDYLRDNHASIVREQVKNAASWIKEMES